MGSQFEEIQSPQKERRGSRSVKLVTLTFSHRGRTGRRDEKDAGYLHVLPTSNDSLPPGRLSMPFKTLSAAEDQEPIHMRARETVNLQTTAYSHHTSMRSQRTPETPNQGAACSFA